MCCWLMLRHLLWLALDPCSSVPRLIVPTHSLMVGTHCRVLTGGARLRRELPRGAWKCTDPGAPDGVPSLLPAHLLPPVFPLLLHVGQHPDHEGQQMVAGKMISW